MVPLGKGKPGGVGPTICPTMSNRTMEHCPSPEKIQAYVDGELLSTEAALVSSHLLSCRRCRNIRDWLVFISQNLSAHSRPPASQRLLELTHVAVDCAEPVAQISCQRAGQLISSYMDNEVKPSEQLLLWRHIFSCSQCYVQFKQTEQVVETLRRRAQPVAVPAGLAECIHHAVDVERVGEGVPVLRRLGWRISWRRVGAVAAGLAAAATLVVGLLLGPQPPAPQKPQMAEAPVGIVQPELTVAELPEVKQPEATTSEITEPETRRSSHRHVVAATNAAPTSHPVTYQPVSKDKDVVVALNKAAAASSDSETAASSLSTMSGERPQPTPRAAPPTGTEDSPRLALYQPDGSRSSPGIESSAVTYTPVAWASQPVYRNIGALADSALDAASEQVNERIDLARTYAARPEITLK